MGVWGLHNNSASTVTVQSATLPGEHDLIATPGWLVPIRDETLIGTALWPPSSPMWALRKVAAGGEIGPHQTVSLVFGVAMTSARTGVAGAPVVVYTANGHSYTLRESLSVQLAAKSCVS
jgi:hypothetical protein